MEVLRVSRKVEPQLCRSFLPGFSSGGAEIQAIEPAL